MESGILNYYKKISHNNMLYFHAFLGARTAKKVCFFRFLFKYSLTAKR